MKIIKVSYQKAFITGPFLQERIGFEAEIDEHLQSVPDALTQLKGMAEDWHKANNPQLDGSDLPEHLKTKITFEQPQPSQVIDYKQKENLEIAIDNATSLADLAGIKDECWKHNLSQQYIIKFNELNNAGSADFTAGLE